MTEQFELLFLMENKISGVIGKRSFWQEQARKVSKMCLSELSKCQTTA